MRNHSGGSEPTTHNHTHTTTETLLGRSGLETALHMGRVMTQTKQSFDWLIQDKSTSEGSGNFFLLNGIFLKMCCERTLFTTSLFHYYETTERY